MLSWFPFNPYRLQSVNGCYLWYWVTYAVRFLTLCLAAGFPVNSGCPVKSEVQKEKTDFVLE